MTTTISAKGQITVPLHVRKSLGLVPGTKLEVELRPDGSFAARKHCEGSFFSKFKGMAHKTEVPYRDSKEAMDVMRGAPELGDIEE